MLPLGRATEEEEMWAGADSAKRLLPLFPALAIEGRHVDVNLIPTLHAPCRSATPAFYPFLEHASLFPT